jgi:PQQ-like domain
VIPRRLVTLIAIAIALSALVRPAVSPLWGGADASGTATPTPNAAAGSMFGSDAAHSGVYAGPPVGLPGVVWSRSFGNAVFASPVVAGATVFVGNLEGNLYALDAGTGAER